MEMIETKTVRQELLDDGRILRLILDAGKGNVIGSAVIGDLRRILESVAKARSVRAVVIDHAGGHFSFGASVDEHVPGEVEKMLPAFHALARELLALGVPLVSAVRGMCLGGGLEVAILADRIVASPTAKFGQPEMALGVFAPIGSALLPRRIGSFAAADLLLSGRVIGVEEAKGFGLVAEIADDPTEAALGWIREHLLPKSASSLRFASHAARRPWLEGFQADLEHLEALYLEELMATPDAREGITAFIEKRKAKWEDD
jgi:cyclohexa-1,5-dienecarbonyl-CoA hydratase